MKILFKITITVSLILSLCNIASANDRGVNGLIIGGGAGAIMGQAVGRNVESTIIGATVGGIIGAVIGAESSHHRSKRIIIQERPHYRNQGRHHQNYSQRNHSPQIEYNRPPHRGPKYQRDTIIVYQQYKGKGKGHYKNDNNYRPHKRKYHKSSNNRHRRQYNYNRW